MSITVSDAAIRKCIEYYTAILEGRPIEWWSGMEPAWRPLLHPSRTLSPLVFDAGCSFRIKAEPKMRPFRPEEAHELLGRKVRWNDGEIGIITSLRGIPHRLHDQLKNLFECAVYFDGPHKGLPAGKVEE